MHYKITYEENPQAADIQLLNNGITEHTQQKKQMKEMSFFAFYLRDDNEKIAGGCAGTNLYGCLYIDQLWIAEQLRGKGYGIQLITETENLAIKNQCAFMAVNTFDWEALDFYKKLGFYVEFERHGFVKNSIFYFLRKDLL